MSLSSIASSTRDTASGLLAVGLHRAGYDLDLRQYGDGHWRATFYVTGLAHSILGGSAWDGVAGGVMGGVGGAPPVKC